MCLCSSLPLLLTPGLCCSLTRTHVSDVMAGAKTSLTHGLINPPNQTFVPSLSFSASPFIHFSFPSNPKLMSCATTRRKRQKVGPDVLDIMSMSPFCRILLLSKFYSIYRSASPAASCVIAWHFIVSFSGDCLISRKRTHSCLRSFPRIEF